MSGKQHEHTQGSIQKIWPIGSSKVTYVIEGDTVVSGRLPILLVIRSKDGLLSYRFRDNRRFFSEKKENILMYGDDAVLVYASTGVTQSVRYA